MHCLALREHRLSRHFWMQVSVQIFTVVMTAALISRFSLLWQNMPILLTRSDSCRSFVMCCRSRWKMALTKRRCWQPSMALNLSSAKQISDVSRKDWCSVCRLWTAGCTMRMHRSFILKNWVFMITSENSWILIISSSWSRNIYWITHIVLLYVLFRRLVWLARESRP